MEGNKDVAFNPVYEASILDDISSLRQTLSLAEVNKASSVGRYEFGSAVTDVGNKVCVLKNDSDELVVIFAVEFVNGGSRDVVSIDFTSTKKPTENILEKYSSKLMGIKLPNSKYEIQESLRFKIAEKRSKPGAPIIPRLVYSKGMIRIYPVGEPGDKSTLATFKINNKEQQNVLNTVKSSLIEKPTQT